MIILEIGTSSAENIFQLIGVSILFIFILVITYYTTRFVGGVKLGQIKKGNFKVLETNKVTQNKYLQLVQIGTRYFVIAVNKDDIRLITELKEDEIIKQEQVVKKNENFLDIITKITNKRNDDRQNQNIQNDNIQNQNKQSDD